jgi:hypothetical protein
VKLTTHLHIVPRLRYAYMAWCLVKKKSQQQIHLSHLPTECKYRAFHYAMQIGTQMLHGGVTVRGCIQKFPDWPLGARTANGTALCHYVQFYRYFVSQSKEFCLHNPLCCFSTSVCCCLFRYRLSPETFGYTLV